MPVSNWIGGSITEEGVPAIEVVTGNQHWQAIIDTGFNARGSTAARPSG
jgi:hypothetical protein